MGGARALEPGRRRLDRQALTETLRAAGCVAADEEARLLLAAAEGDGGRLDALAGRRLAGEPIAWITGTTTFCGLQIHVTPGVYVPRPHTEQLARHAARRLPPTGLAVDVCTGCGAVAAVLAALRPGARVLATDVDAGAVACARRNGVDARRGDLFTPLPADLAGRADVIVAACPYVPTPELRLLQRDTFTFETPLAYDGGPDGTDLLRRLIAAAPRLVRPGGALLVELGAGQPDLLERDLRRHGFTAVHVLADEDGDVRGIEATLVS